MVDDSQPNDPTVLKQVAAAAGGTLLYSIMFLFKDIIPHQQGVFSPTGPPRIPPPLGFLSRASGLMTMFQFQFIGFAVVAVLAVVRRHERRAWIYASLAGLAFPYVVFHLLKLV